MCGGFTCSRNTLAALNILYVVVSFILIGVAAYGIAASFITSLAIIGGIIACGVFLFLLSLLGLLGALRHNQVLLFFYMIILFLLFIVQFSIACACLAFNEEQQHHMAYKGWQEASKSLRNETQFFFNCCHFENSNSTYDDKDADCKLLPCCHGQDDCSTTCPVCWEKLQTVIDNALRISGGIGLFFSFTEALSVCLAYRYRKQKDPKVNPSLLFI